MKLSRNLYAMSAAALLAGSLAAGCSSSSDCSDGGTCTTDTAAGTGGSGGGGGGSGGASGLFGITEGTYCFKITAIDSGAVDGCDIQVALQVGQYLPVKYLMSTAMLTVGTDGSLGGGPIANNKGTLTRDNTPAAADMPTCTWHQTDTTMVTVTAENMFTAAVVEKEETFAAACSADHVPPGGMCTSSWTWTMKIVPTTEKSPDNGCK
ncbi:MAG: hypothetical protein QOI66_898 [Myxococcales bacterium]|jgi:hypothetical protein|nr:hypothetical protein [Myxococcales bacterium]